MQNLKEAKILLTGGNGFLGKRVYHQLLEFGAKKENIYSPSQKELNLLDMENCTKAVKDVDVVIHLAANVGGIGYNRENPGVIFFDNAVMGVNLIEASRIAKVKKFVQVGTVCAYPKVPPHMPFLEEDLWEGYPEETNAPYGIAKKMLLAQLLAYRQQYNFNGIYLIPVNLYGPNDKFDPKFSHVIPALIKKFVEAVEQGLEEVVVWGSGKASREFLYVEDAARGIVMATLKYNKQEPINLGSSFEIKIKELALLISKLTGFNGKIVWDKTKPDGQPRRKLNVKKAQKEFGFSSKINFEKGLKKTIDWYRQNNKIGRN